MKCFKALIAILCLLMATQAWATKSLYDWPVSIKITIDTSNETGVNVTSNQANFPLYVNLNSSSVPNATTRGLIFAAYNNVSGHEGRRMAFYDCDGTTELSYLPPIKWDYANQEGIWLVKVPQVDGDSATDCIYVGFGADIYGADQNATAANSLDSYWKGFWPLGDNYWTTVAVDATSNANNGTNSGTGGTSSVAGIVGNGRSFDGNDYITFGDDTDFEPGSSDFYFSGWIKTNTQTESKLIWGKSRTDPSLQRSYHLYTNTSGQLEVRTSSDGTNYTPATAIAGSTDIVDDSWHYIAMRKCGTDMYLRYDNTADASVTGTTPSSVYSGSSAAALGVFPNATPALYFVGNMDEPKMSVGSCRSADWSSLEYYSMKKTNYNGDDLLSYGTAQYNANVAATTSPSVVLTPFVGDVTSVETTHMDLWQRNMVYTLVTGGTLDYSGFPGYTVACDGTEIAMFFRSDNHPSLGVDASIWKMTRTFGQPWSTPVEFSTHPEGYGVTDVSLATLSDCTIVLSAEWADFSEAVRIPYIRKSVDNGVTFGSEIIVRESPGGTNSGPVVELDNGDLLQPLYKSYACYFMKSTDGGDTWTELSSIPSTCEEPRLAYIGGDEIRMLERSGNTSLSTDRGVTWTPKNDILVILSEPTLSRFNNGKIFIMARDAVNSDPKYWLSTDNGNSVGTGTTVTSACDFMYGQSYIMQNVQTPLVKTVFGCGDFTGSCDIKEVIIPISNFIPARYNINF